MVNGKPGYLDENSLLFYVTCNR